MGGFKLEWVIFYRNGCEMGGFVQEWADLGWNVLFYFILFYFILFYFILFYFIYYPVALVGFRKTIDGWPPPVSSAG